MPAVSHTTIDLAIRTAAIAKGFADVSIVPQTVADRAGALDGGQWFCLFTKLRRRRMGITWPAALEGRAAGNVEHEGSGMKGAWASKEQWRKFASAAERSRE